MKHCRECGHSDLFLRRSDGRCGLTTQGSKNGPCMCACIYGDSAVLAYCPDLGQYLEREDDEVVHFTPDRAQAERLTLDGARWFERRCPFAVRIEVLR